VTKYSGFEYVPEENLTVSFGTGCPLGVTTRPNTKTESFGVH
jgi:hypothetical protein